MKSKEPDGLNLSLDDLIKKNATASRGGGGYHRGGGRSGGSWGRRGGGHAGPGLQNAGTTKQQGGSQRGMTYLARGGRGFSTGNYRGGRGSAPGGGSMNQEGGGLMRRGRGPHQTAPETLALQRQVLLQQQQLNLLMQRIGTGGVQPLQGAQGTGRDMMEEDDYGGAGGIALAPALTLLPQQQKQGLTNNTFSQSAKPEVWLNEDTGDVVATLKGTDIVTVSPTGEVTLRTGGSHTPTTLAGMNEVLNLISLQVLAEGNPHDAQWKVGTGHSLIRFYEGIQIHAKTPADCNRAQIILSAFQNSGGANDLAAAASAASTQAALQAGLGGLGTGIGPSLTGGMRSGLGVSGGFGSAAFPAGGGLLGLSSAGGMGMGIGLSGGFPVGVSLGGQQLGGGMTDAQRRLARQGRLQ